MNRYLFLLSSLSVLISTTVYGEAEIAPQQLLPADVLIEAINQNFNQDTCIERDNEGRFLGWLDNQHCFLSSRATQTAQWLDGLFGQDHSENEYQAKSRIRIVNDFSWLEGSGLSADMRIRASLKLPNAKRRFHLVISEIGRAHV